MQKRSASHPRRIAELEARAYGPFCQFKEKFTERSVVHGRQPCTVLVGNLLPGCDIMYLMGHTLPHPLLRPVRI